MTTDMDARLSEIKDRAEKATAGEWRPVYRKNGRTLIEIQAPNGYAVIDAEEYAGDCWINSADADVDFIAHALSDISFLLAKIKMGDEEREKRFGHYVADCAAAIFGEPTAKGEHAFTESNMAAMHNAWKNFHELRSRLEQEGTPPIALRDTQPDYQRILTTVVPVTVGRNTQIVDPDTGCLTELGAALLNGLNAQIAELRRLLVPPTYPYERPREDGGK